MTVLPAQHNGFARHCWQTAQKCQHPWIMEQARANSHSQAHLPAMQELPIGCSAWRITHAMGRDLAIVVARPQDVGQVVCKCAARLARVWNKHLHLHT